MSTFLFDKIIFGPVKSRRLGISLGINLMPTDLKYCNFDCIYCECGWTLKDQLSKAKFHERDDVKLALEKKLKEFQLEDYSIDVITFAGNGEPTLHHYFNEIINDTIDLRNKYFPKVKIAVLSNSTMIHKESVFDALQKVDYNIMKLDSGIEETVKKINQPKGNFSLQNTIQLLKKFNGNVYIQTMFLKGKTNNEFIDNTTEEEVSSWLKVISEISPKHVMIYPIERETPAQGLEKVSNDKLKEISARIKLLGIDVLVAE